MDNKKTDLPEAYERLTATDLLGTMLFLFGIALLVLSYFSSRANFGLDLPRFWYRASWMWPFLGIAFAVAGFFIQHRLKKVPASWKPSLPGQRFERVVLYTREECHLCDVAKDTLHEFQAWLPEIEEIDIGESEALTKRFGTTIPVVEIDGTVRFSGIVNVELLKRLIEGSKPFNSDATSPTRQN